MIDGVRASMAWHVACTRGPAVRLRALERQHAVVTRSSIPTPMYVSCDGLRLGYKPRCHDAAMKAGLFPCSANTAALRAGAAAAPGLAGADGQPPPPAAAAELPSGRAGARAAAAGCVRRCAAGGRCGGMDLHGGWTHAGRRAEHGGVILKMSAVACLVYKAAS